MMSANYSSKGAAAFIKNRSAQVAENKRVGNMHGNTFKMPSLEEHMDATSAHLSAARMVEPHDHESAADHLQKVSVHSAAAAQHFEKHSKKWIQGAIKHPGAFTTKAKAAGKTVKQEAASVLKKGSHASSTTKKQAVLAKTLGSFHHK